MTTGRGAAALGPRQRDDGWHDLSTSTFDVLVVGGGITGAGVALDAATRGLRVALVEARDLASGVGSPGAMYTRSLVSGGARGGVRTRTTSRSEGFKPSASASYATRATGPTVAR